MQRGSLALVSRKEGPDVWQFRWSEKDLHGVRVQRKRVIGTVERYPDGAAARTAMTIELAELNSGKARISFGSITVAPLCDHFEQREITGDKRNIVRIIPETGLRVYKELMPMKKSQLDLQNAVVWIPDSKTPNGVAEVPLTPIAVDAFRDQFRLSPCSPYLFPSDENPSGHQKTLKTIWHATLRRAQISYFRIYDLRSTYATRLSAGGVADEWATQLLRQGDAKAFKKYSQMKLQMTDYVDTKVSSIMPMAFGTFV